MALFVCMQANLLLVSTYYLYTYTLFLENSMVDYAKSDVKKSHALVAAKTRL